MAWVKRELSQLGIPPLKRFGQHFLIDTSVRDELANRADLTPHDAVLEVGPGLGFLTTALAARAGHVTAIEKDRTLAAYLIHKFAQHSNVEVVQGDALKTPIPSQAKVVSSPPYNISSKLTLHIIGSGFKSATLLLQEDFVRRLTSDCGSRGYGRLSVMLQSKAQAEYIEKVSRFAFYPRPRVDSALVAINPIKDHKHIEDVEGLTDLVRMLFTQRRRKLRKVLARYLASKYPVNSEKIITKIDVSEKRVYELSPDEFIELSNSIVNAMKQPGA
ncbi:MAG TPA: 16S rRNA (adenine(1518)-N(6)/adenine(1519)-N(6))-dimethyltransferase RsmA [Candidatus Acidoferrales bacterium]|nr:16S rRNA (adenine(1518)-N(6)/adenine(1519)-N(6))-dimethyltransferase RsmA [Candidatus Acidoferrales bacterium]